VRHGIGHRLQPLLDVLGRHPGEDRRVKGRELSTGLRFSLRRGLGSGGGFLGHASAFARLLRFVLERPGHQPRDHANDQLDADAHRDRGRGVVLTEERPRQGGFAEQLGHERRDDGCDRTGKTESNGAFERQDVGDRPHGVPRLGRGPDEAVDDHDVEQERPHPHAVQLPFVVCSVGEHRDQEVPYGERRHERKAKWPRVPRAVDVVAQDEGGLDDAEHNDEPAQGDEPALEPPTLVKIPTVHGPPCRGRHLTNPGRAAAPRVPSPSCSTPSRTA
jgi:hypothetical protein